MNIYRKIIFFISIIILSTISGFSQETENKFMVSPNGDTIFIKAIPDAELTTNIEVAVDIMKKIELRLEPNIEISKFDSSYLIAQHDLDSLKHFNLKVKEFNSVKDIDNALKEWESYSSDLNNWKDKINERIKVLEEDQFEVTLLSEIWATSLRQSKESGVPATVLTNVNELAQKLNALKKELKTKQNEALRKQNELTELRLIVDEVINFLNETRKIIQADYFRQDSPPIWSATDSSASVNQVKQQVNKNIEENRRNLDLFYYANQNTLIFQLFLFIFLWIGFYFLYKHSANINEIDDKLNIENARSIISNYGLSALIICLFTSLWLYTSIVSTVGEILQLLYILIALMFLPRHTDKRLRTVLFVLLGLFLSNIVQEMFSGKLLVTRLIIFIENIITAWILYKLVSPRYFIAKELKKHNWEILLKLIPIFFLFLAASVIGNIFGFVNLAILLSNTTVNALFNLNLLILVIMVFKQTNAILLRTSFLQNSNIIRINYQLIEKRIMFFIQLAGIFLWLRSVLRLLGLYEGLQEWFSELLTITWDIGKSTIAVEGIINFILVIIGTFVFNKIIKSLLKDELYPRVKMPRGVPGAISMITGYIIAGYGIFIALGAAGADLKSFGLVAGALGVGIGFGLQGIVANFIAGLVLAFERPIQEGDTIEIGTMMGDVTHIGVRACTIKTFDGSEVIVPNSSLITNDVINWTLTDRRKRRDINISAAYGSDPEEVLALIKKVAEEHPSVLKIPAPWALFDGFGDNSLDFRIRIWTTMDNGMTTKSSVAVDIYKALRSAGIEIPFPQRDLHIRTIDPDIKSLVSKNKGPASKKAPRKTKPSQKKTDTKTDSLDESDTDNQS